MKSLLLALVLAGTSPAFAAAQTADQRDTTGPRRVDRPVVAQRSDRPAPQPGAAGRAAQPQPQIQPQRGGPVFVVVGMAPEADTEALKGILDRMGASVAAASGLVLARAETSEVWEGEGRARRVAVIRFERLELATAWREGDAYKEFVADLSVYKAAPSVEVFRALPGGSGGRVISFDQKAFEPMMRKTDEALSRFKTICTNC